MNETFNLYRLQILDTRRHEIKTRIAEIDAIMARDKAVKAAMDARDAAQASLKQAESVVKDIRDQAAQKKLKLELNQANLFGGKVRVPKELQDLQAESDALNRTIAKLEDEQFGAMVEVENQEAALMYAETQLQAAINAKASENSLLLGERGQLESELPRIEVQRSAVKTTLDDKAFEEYKTLYKNKARRAVAEVVDGCCGVCGVELTPAEKQMARSPSVVLKCHTCGRILYQA